RGGGKVIRAAVRAGDNVSAEPADHPTRNKQRTSRDDRRLPPTGIQRARRPHFQSFALALAAAAAFGGGLIETQGASAEETGWQAPASVRAAAETFARNFTGRPNAAVDAVAVDDRLRLPRCGQPL